MATADKRIEGNESNRTLIIVVAVVAAVLIAGVFGVLMQLSSRGPSVDTGLQGAIRAGSPQFEEYKSKIFLDDPEATDRNLTGKTLTGLEIRAAVVDYEGRPVKERTVVVIPTRQPELAPNKTMPVAVSLDGMKDTDVRANIKMEVTAFKFKE
jgi:hypothetical protein